MTSEARPFEFDVALSFAGEDRIFVAAIASKLKLSGIRVFYDEDYEAELWGEDLIVYLDEVYRKRSQYTLVFISRHYAAKQWTRHERRSVQARAFEDATVSLLPIQLDNTQLPGLHPTVAYVDASKHTADSLTRLVLTRLGRSEEAVASSELQPIIVPNSIVEIRQLIEGRPDGWEFLAYLGWLKVKTQELEPIYLDFEVGYAADSGKAFRDIGEAVLFVGERVNSGTRITRNFDRLLTPTVQGQAFGEPGQPGNPHRIEHFASRTVDLYRELLEVATEIRGTIRPDECDELYEIGARFFEGPINAHRRFVEDFELQLLDALERARRGEHVNITLTVTWDIADELSARFEECLDELSD